jgi:hypothetical protein
MLLEGRDVVITNDYVYERSGTESCLTRLIKIASPGESGRFLFGKQVYAKG